MNESSPQFIIQYFAFIIFYFLPCVSVVKKVLPPLNA